MDDLSMTPYSFYQLSFEDQLAKVSMRLVSDYEFFSHDMDHRRKLLIALDPRWQELEAKLLSLGGTSVCIQPEPHLEQLLGRGEEYSGDAVLDLMEPSACHSNVAELWTYWSYEDRSTDVFKVVTGWALSDDGMWRQHSWGKAGIATVETTDERLKYFGFTMNDAEALAFSVCNNREFADFFMQSLEERWSEGEPLEEFEAQGLALIKSTLEHSK